jgi:sulfide:quinone oxidoreductase
VVVSGVDGAGVVPAAWWISTSVVEQPAEQRGSGMPDFGRRDRDELLWREPVPGGQSGVVTRNVVVLGGGTGGTIAANRLRRALDDDVVITVVDRDDDHVYQPGLLFLPFGMSAAEDLVRPRARQLRAGVRFTDVAVDWVDVDADRVYLEGGGTLDYDVLVVATGARLLPEETDGLTGPGWGDRVFTFYDLPGATALAGALRAFNGGRLVVNVVDMPVKCPVAPLEFCFLADWYLRERGIRDAVELTYVTPLDGAFTKPVAAATLGGLLAEKGIELVTEFNTGSVDGVGGRLVSFDGREVPFDLAVVVPLHGGASYVDRTPGLGDELGFVPADPRTLQSTARPNIFVIGDAAAVPTSKAGSVTHFEGEVLTGNIVRYLAGEELDEEFDGHTNCFIESGFGKALLIDFNYDTEPLPGHFPAAVGLPLLKESRLNHLGKLMFSWLYWHSLLPGRDIPGIPVAMPTAGKHVPTRTAEEGAR